MNILNDKKEDELIFDADRDNNGIGISIDEMFNLLKEAHEY